MTPSAPVAWEWQHAAAWPCVEFVSDLHLSAALPRTFDAFVAYLRSTQADAVVILGDLFEVWVGDDARDGAFEQTCLQALKEASSQRPLAFMVGNRDFLLGPAYLAAAGLTGLPDPTVLTLGGRRLLLSHGDALCLADTDYQDFRTLVRSPAWQQAFLAKPLLERQQIAARIRSESRSRRSFDGSAAADVDVAEALRWLRVAHSHTLIHGHTHRPAEHRLGLGIERRLVLSDWDLDDPVRPRAEVLRWTAAGAERVAWLPRA
jgi:UDP-2,3-diacylglucosamine hydrolase